MQRDLEETMELQRKVRQRVLLEKLARKRDEKLAAAGTEASKRQVRSRAALNYKASSWKEFIRNIKLVD